MSFHSFLSESLLRRYDGTSVAGLIQTKSPPRTTVGAGLIFAYIARGTTLFGNAPSSE